MSHFSVDKATDEELLARYDAAGDQRAFAEIVRRHGPMVMSTARRLSLNLHDVEEVFQATFFALAKGAAKIRDKAALAAWLHRVSHTCALKVSNANHRSKTKGSDMLEDANAREAGELESEQCTPEEAACNEELKRLLDEELSRLPSKLHVAVVLCDLVGLTHKQAASQTGVSSSTISERVARGRKLLRAQLMRRGITTGFAAVGAAVATSTEEATAQITRALVAETAKQSMLFAASPTPDKLPLSTKAVQLANEVLASMHLAKVLTTGLVAIVLVAIATVSLVVAQSVSSGSSQRIPLGTLFYEDFSDGNHNDGSPAMWSRSSIQAVGNFDSSSGDLVLSPTSGTGEEGVAIGVDDTTSRDTSARTQVRVTQTGGFAFLAVRGQGNGDTRCYFAGVGFAPEFGGSFVTAGRSDGGNAFQFFSPLRNRAMVHRLPYDVRRTDTVLQVDAIGDTVEVRTWRPGRPFPENPAFGATDSTYPSGSVGMGLRNNVSQQGTGTSKAIFRFVHVANQRIHEESLTAED